MVQRVRNTTYRSAAVVWFWTTPSNCPELEEVRNCVKKQKRTDKRVVRTQRLLREALIALTLERGWDEVSVLDVCERSDVGRSTFYVHFADKEELLLSGYDALRGHLHQIRGEKKGELAFIDELVAHAKGNLPLFRAIVGKRSGAVVQRRFRDLVLELVSADLEEHQGPAPGRELVARYLSGAFVEMLLYWLDHPTQVKSEVIASEFSRLSKVTVRGWMP